MQPRLQEAQAGKRVVLFMDAAHLYCRRFLVIFGVWHASLSRLQQVASVSTSWACSMQSHMKWRRLPMIPTLTLRAFACYWRRLHGFMLVCQSRFFSITRVTKDVLWWSKKPKAWTSNYAFCHPTRPIWIWLSAVGSLWKRNVCTPSITKTFLFSNPQFLLAWTKLWRHINPISILY